MVPRPFVITITGPESSGKTTLAMSLADQWGVPWVPEYAREYLENLGRAYEEYDLEAIAKGQWARIREQLLVSREVSCFDEHTITGSPSCGQQLLAFPLEEFGDVPRPILIIDSGMLSLRMWARLKYGIAIPFVEEVMQYDATSLYLLCRPSQDWASDPLREAPSVLERVWIYNHYLAELYGIKQLRADIQDHDIG